MQYPKFWITASNICLCSSGCWQETDIFFRLFPKKIFSRPPAWHDFSICAGQETELFLRMAWFTFSVAHLYNACDAQIRNTSIDWADVSFKMCCTHKLQKCFDPQIFPDCICSLYIRFFINKKPLSFQDYLTPMTGFWANIYQILFEELFPDGWIYIP